MSSVPDVFSGISRKYSEVILKEKLLMDALYFIKKHLWISGSDEATLKKKKYLVEVNPPQS